MTVSPTAKVWADIGAVTKTVAGRQAKELGAYAEYGAAHTAKPAVCVCVCVCSAAAAAINAVTVVREPRGGKDGRSSLLIASPLSCNAAAVALESQLGMKVRLPTTWTILQNDDPCHLGLRCNALPEHQMALITSGCVPFSQRRWGGPKLARCPRWR